MSTVLPHHENSTRSDEVIIFFYLPQLILLMDVKRTQEVNTQEAEGGTGREE